MKQLYPYVDQINEEWKKLSSPPVSDEALRAKTQEVKGIIDERLKDIDDQIADLQKQVEDQPQLGLDEKEKIFNEIDSLEEQRNKSLEEVLMEVMPTAFAIVKETARRFKENEKLEVKANFWDKELAAKKSNVEIDGEKAIWHNKWMAAGAEITWAMVHYDVQLIGGVVLHQGKVAEMATGEGKTLVATLPAFLNALAKRGVHVITVNDYLARRDSEWMAPIYEFHGLSVDCIDHHQPNSQARRNAYLADITYGTNNEFGFDYLRDNMNDEVDSLVQRPHHYAMIDEVDSVLIDEARTPLIISGPVPRGDEHEYQDLKPRIAKLVEAQRKLVLGYLNESKRKIKEGKEKEAGLPLFRAFRGMPKLKPLIKFQSETGMKALLQKTEAIYLAENSKLMPEADEPLYFTIDEKNNQIDLTEKGIDSITGAGEDPKFFIMPDIGIELDAIDKDETLSPKSKLEKKDSVINDYTVKAARIHSINQLLKAYTLFEKEEDYIIVDNEVKIVDEHTGRAMQGRRYSDGLHQALEAKENVKIQDATQTYATITLQNYFRMYHKLAGMTGTAETEAGELWDIYKLDVVVIPTNVPIIRDDANDLIFRSVREKYNAIAEEIVRLTEEGRPVLVGTSSVDSSELISRLLTLRKIKHQVLNAKLHQKEAEIVAEAGKSGTVTIATNMAGRGTDIKLKPDSKEAGGLAIIGTERHESRRVDRQLRGRAGRQGDPGSSQFFVSLEDNLMRLFGSDRMARIMDRMGIEEGEVIQHSMITKSIERAQKKVEENNFGIRKRLLEYDDVMNSQREIIYKRRKNALFGDRLEFDVLNTFYDACEDTIRTNEGLENFENFKFQVFSTFGLETTISEEDYGKLPQDQLAATLYEEVLARYNRKNEEIVKNIYPQVKRFYDEKKNLIGEDDITMALDVTDGRKIISIPASLKKVIASEGKELIRTLEKKVTLAVIDQEWKEHLRDMDDLKQSVQSAVYEQKDPLIIYKFEGYELFERFVARVNGDMVSFLSKAFLPVNESKDDQVKEAKRKRTRQKVKENKAQVQSVLSGASQANAQVAEQQTATKEKSQPVKVGKSYGRNDLVTVQYRNGDIKKKVKFKKVEQDIKNNDCVIVED